MVREKKEKKEMFFGDESGEWGDFSLQVFLFSWRWRQLCRAVRRLSLDDYIEILHDAIQFIYFFN